LIFWFLNGREEAQKEQKGRRLATQVAQIFRAPIFVLFVPFCGKLLLLKCGADLVPVEALDLGGGHAGEGFFG
jgi:hypothetical protein